MMARRGLCVVAAALVMACTEHIGPRPAPARPTDLQVTLISLSSVHLTWNAGSPADDDVSYDVYRNDVKVGTTSTTDFTDSGLAGNTTYTWFVTAKTPTGLVSAPSDPAVMPFGDNEAPKVFSNSPANASTGISRLPAPSVTFSEPMIPGTVSAATMVATITTSGALVYGTVNYDVVSRTADFWPLSFLPAGTSITITVGIGVRDLAGNGLASPFTFSFVTGGTPASVTDLPPNAEQILISQAVDSQNLLYPAEIYKLRPDGTGKVNLTHHPASEIDAAWSPDGRHVAFASDRNGSFDIFIMREDGRGVRQLTGDGVDEAQPTWSPDARRIIYRSRKDGVAPSPSSSVAFDIFAMNADGTQQVNLTRTPGVYEEWASLSPDGRRLLFSRSIELCCETTIMVANADGTGAVPLRAANPRYDDDLASWSPDGTQIALSAYDRQSPMYTQLFNLFLLNADGSNARQLPSNYGPRQPSWSPDGRMLVYSFAAFAETWGRFGLIEVRALDLTTGSETILAPRTPTSQIMSPQAWRR